MGTLIDDRTKKLMLIKKQRELDALFAEQEANRSRTQLKRLKKFWDGGTTDGPDDDMLGYFNTTPITPENYGGYQQPEYQANNSWDVMTNPGPKGVSSINFGGGEYTETPENAFNLKDTLQVYGPDYVKKAKGVIPGLIQLAPALSNLFAGKATQLDPRDYYNTNSREIAKLMRNRRVDIGPQLAAILGSERSALYNLRNVAGSRGEFMGNATAISNRAMANRTSTLANKQNMDLGYKGEEAQALMNLGNQEAQVNWNTRQWNEQSLANKRNMFREGLSQLSQYSQIKGLAKNQKLSDQEKLAALKDMLGPLAQFMESLGLVQTNLSGLNKATNTE